jgi:hypothetical protein
MKASVAPHVMKGTPIFSEIHVLNAIQQLVIANWM